MNVDGSQLILRTPRPEENELIRCARAMFDRCGAGWSWHDGTLWAFLTPSDSIRQMQGWKLHVAATPDNALAVLSSVMPVLLEQRVSFKFVNSRLRLEMLNAPTADAASAGKFVTVYPVSDAQAVGLAEQLDRVTSDYVGPDILSDRPFRPGSLIHYRYGGFHPQLGIDNDGVIVQLIRRPDGRLVPDKRVAWYNPPDWAVDPFQAPDSDDGPAEVMEVLLAGRYAVDEVVQQQNKGGVYLAHDRRSGRRVVIKEGRPHTGGRIRGGDARMLIEHEARMLRLVEGLGVAPRFIDLFDHQGHVFLVTEHLEGAPLWTYLERKFHPSGDGIDAEEVIGLARQLAELMAAVHARRIVLRDFNPNNILVVAGELRIVDLELAWVLADSTSEPPSGGTPAYSAPEQLAGREPSLADDYYSLGATIAVIATGSDPYMEPEPAPARSIVSRLDECLARLLRDGLLRPRIREIILGCMADDPATRRSPADVLAVLDAEATPELIPGVDLPRPPTQAELACAAADVCAWLLHNMADDSDDRLWPTSSAGTYTDPRAVQAGASGVGLVLCRAIRMGAQPAYRVAVERAARWVLARLEHGPRPMPGLYFGQAGISWFLAEAALALDDDDLLARSTELALSCPTHSPNPDVTHGMAGVGMAQLHQWLVTGDQRFLNRAAEVAENIAACSTFVAGGHTWCVPRDYDSLFAGRTMYGFAHGSAGICHFLLCVAQATDDQQYTRIARAGLDVLIREARVDGDEATWATGPERDGPWVYWCHGSSGVGTALIRAFAITGDEQYRRLAEMAAAAVMRSRWRGPVTQCHGLAGNAEFLLDMHRFLDEPGYRAMAFHLAEAIWARRTYRDEGVVFADDNGRSVSADYSLGLAGTGSLLLRLTSGGTRMLMLDELLTVDQQQHMS